ncbi:hypothetical protein E2C01_026150 [Portunus trituberculatus]|uniref:Uncharacterized protein n=1 Tax=Portunus trituberculatus TaxID=210409 RepID=A0A5B7EHV6_PORTR|nr:hypothetical protein [Portunus trituberculatus]
MKANTEVLMKNYDGLKNKVCASEKKMEDNEDQVKKISEKQNRWKMDQDQRRVSFKKIIEESAKEREQEVAKTVVNVIKEKENLVRDTVEKKKCIVIFGLKEKLMPMRHKRKEYEKNQAEKVVMEVKDDDEEPKRLSKEIEEVYRLGKHEEGKTRPLKIRIRLQTSAEQSLAGSWRLERKKKCIKMYG